jgi:hypothetical protein
MPSQYAEQPQTPDFEETLRRIKAQYTTSPQGVTTLGDYSWSAPGARPWASAAGGGGGTPGGAGINISVSGGGGAGESQGGGRRPVKLDVKDLFPEEAPPLGPPPPPIPEDSPFRVRGGSTRDFNDEPIRPITGSFGGTPVVGGPRPKPGGLSGGGVAEEPAAATPYL